MVTEAAVSPLEGKYLVHICYSKLSVYVTQIFL